MSITRHVITRIPGSDEALSRAMIETHSRLVEAFLATKHARNLEATVVSIAIHIAEEHRWLLLGRDAAWTADALDELVFALASEAMFEITMAHAFITALARYFTWRGASKTLESNVAAACARLIEERRFFFVSTVSFRIARGALLAS